MSVRQAASCIAWTVTHHVCIHVAESVLPPVTACTTMSSKLVTRDDGKTTALGLYCKINMYGDGVVSHDQVGRIRTEGCFLVPQEYCWLQYVSQVQCSPCAHSSVLQNCVSGDCMMHNGCHRAPERLLGSILVIPTTYEAKRIITCTPVWLCVRLLQHE